jgi:hypothetical protein
MYMNKLNECVYQLIRLEAGTSYCGPVSVGTKGKQLRSIFWPKMRRQEV